MPTGTATAAQGEALRPRSGAPIADVAIDGLAHDADLTDSPAADLPGEQRRQLHAADRTIVAPAHFIRPVAECGVVNQLNDARRQLRVRVEGDGQQNHVELEVDETLGALGPHIAQRRVRRERRPHQWERMTEILERRPATPWKARSRMPSPDVEAMSTIQRLDAALRPFAVEYGGLRFAYLLEPGRVIRQVVRRL